MAMSNSLEEALRAATTLATTSTTQPKKPKQKKKRRRADSRASDEHVDAALDPVQRAEAFRARMFEMEHATTVSAVVKTGDEVAQVQWKKSKKSKAGVKKQVEEDDVVMPHVVRVVKAQVKDEKATAPLSKAAKKKQKKEAKAHLVSMGMLAPAKEKDKAKEKVTAPVTKAAGKQLNKPSPIEAAVAKSTNGVKTTADAPTAKTVEGPTTNGTLTVAEKTQITSANSRKRNKKKKKKAQAAVAAPAPSPVTEESKAESFVKTKETPEPKKSTTSGPKATQPPKKDTKDVSTGKPQPKAPRPKAPQPKAPQPKAPQTKTLSTKPQEKPVLAKKPDRVQEEKSAESVEDDSWDIDALMASTMKAMESSRKTRRKLSSDEEDSDHESVASDSAEDNESEDELDATSRKKIQHKIFSRLIDDAARDEWELMDIGRLVRIFAAQWSHDRKKTAQFLRTVCPELVSVDFMEGLNINLTSQDLLKIFDEGSGTPVVFMNKLASAVENGELTVRDEAVLDIISTKTQQLGTNREVLEFLMPLLESLSKVKDVGLLLKNVCAHWHLDQTIALVQEILLTSVFDDLDGQQDELLEEMPHLAGKLDFPSRMDEEDADEDGNLKGLVVGEDSDLGEEEASSADEAEEALGDVQSDEEESDGDEEVYEGETDSEEEAEAAARLRGPTKRRRSRFILDEAEEDDDEELEEDEEDFIADDDVDDDVGDEDVSEESSSDDEAPRQRKRLRKGK
ncbi:hypothetical protein Poli38472_000649 [Pythium oligandrum]|uniref:Uncharacterized protein n=1 Tax=Pythium oligandrum TaxID=41045 RepID=A0A8K1CCB3_PYTOL|nr:hypothetical protein Poli38472_000649 [Pythium oligandrum]|eukprot:TMW60607.1 hypothetical protein Poli38472_000649 [Pythium oligandrum]